MNDLAIGTTLGILLLMQTLIIRECIRMKGHVSNESLYLKSEMGNLGTLLDEALDYVADLANGPSQVSPAISQTVGGFKEMALTALINKVMMQPDHGSKTQQEEWQVREEQPKTLETETESN